VKKLFEKKIFRYIALPIIVGVIYFCLVYFIRYLGFPSPEEIIAFTERYYETYGYWVVLVGALVEGALLINWYLPGSIVVALGVIFAKASGLSVLLMLSLIIFGFFSTALINYFFGRYGWYHVFLKLGLKAPLEKVQSQVRDKGLKILFTTYVHPNFGALAATASGILKLPFLKFALYSFISITLWNSLWTILFYYFGSFLLEHMTLLIVFGGVFVYFMLVRSFKEHQVDIP
jgi:membrane protein DedA with SNARE-associated domain